MRVCVCRELIKWQEVMEGEEKRALNAAEAEDREEWESLRVLLKVTMLTWTGHICNFVLFQLVVLVLLRQFLFLSQMKLLLWYLINGNFEAVYRILRASASEVRVDLYFLLCLRARHEKRATWVPPEPSLKAPCITGGRGAPRNSVRQAERRGQLFRIIFPPCSALTAPCALLRILHPSRVPPVPRQMSSDSDNEDDEDDTLQGKVKRFVEHLVVLGVRGGRERERGERT